MMSELRSGPHQGQPVYSSGAPLGSAQAALVMVHGRGSSAESILTLAAELEQPSFAYLAPQAAGNTWYPFSFLSPIERNEPYLSSALAALADVLARIAGAGIPAERTMLLGFSQGACLALELCPPRSALWRGRRPERRADWPRRHTARLRRLARWHADLLGCGDTDPHISVARVQHSAEVLQGLGGAVTTRLYPRMGDVVNQDEIAFVRAMMAALIER